MDKIMLTRIGDMLIGFGWGYIVFYVLPKLKAEITELLFKGESTKWK